jgi:hypothetical protein
MAHHVPHLIANSPGAERGTPSCPSSKYILCVDITKASGATVGLCISTSGDCTSGLIGDWNFTATITTLKGKKFKKIGESWYPDPGNPSTQTMTEKKKIKGNGTKIKYVDNINACEVTNPSSCLAGAVGIIPD